MNTEIVTRQGQAEIMERVIMMGDLSKLTPEERVTYYMRICESIGLNPLSRPFDYITLSGKLTLYARKDATEQLRRNRKISIISLEKELTGDGIYIVTAAARDSEGREDIDTGVVNVKGLGGEALANAYMKAITKAKRRVTLSICGLGFLDETEIETIPDARPVVVDDKGVIRGEITRERTVTTGDPVKDEHLEHERQEQTAEKAQPAKQAPKPNGHKTQPAENPMQLFRRLKDVADTLGIDTSKYVVRSGATADQLAAWNRELSTAIVAKEPPKITEVEEMAIRREESEEPMLVKPNPYQ